MFERGTLKIGRYRGAPLLLHWSLLLGLLAFGGLRVLPGFWLGFTLLVLIHELGHAYLVRRMGLFVEAVVVHGFGGFCRWRGQATRLEHAVIAWGGVVAQAWLLLGTLLYLQLAGPPESAFGRQLVSTWVETNLWVIVLNLLPVAPLDGADAWQLFRAMRVESVSFGAIVRRCLPFRWSRQRPRREPESPGTRQPSAATGEGKPSPEAQAAIAEALEKISREAKEAREKKR